MGTWGTSTAGPSTAIYQSLGTLRARSRETGRNNPLIEGGIGSYVANIIGSGINPRWQLDDSELKNRIQSLWEDWAVTADFNNVLGFYGLQSLACRELIEAGEIFCRLIPRRPEEGLVVPLQIQLLESDHLDETYNTVAENGNEIRMGIEIDAEGRRVAYHVWNDHPGEAFITQKRVLERKRIPVSEMLHIFRLSRAGQMRGRPWLASIILRMHELDQYEDAELVRKKTAAMYGGFITEAMAAGDPSAFFGKRSGDDDGGRAVVALEPGTFPILPSGMDVKFSQPVDVGQTYEVWIKQQLREIAKGIGITYEQFTGDLTDVNYSSIRAGLLEFRRCVGQIQREILIHQFCRPVAEAWLDQAVSSGAIPIPDYFRKRKEYLRITWRPDGWAWVDPLKDQEAEKSAVRSGFKSRSQVIAESGGDIETVDREISEDNERADRLGLVFDTDPRKGEGTEKAFATSEDAEEGEEE